MERGERASDRRRRRACAHWTHRQHVRDWLSSSRRHGSRESSCCASRLSLGRFARSSCCRRRSNRRLGRSSGIAPAWLVSGGRRTLFVATFERSRWTECVLAIQFGRTRPPRGARRRTDSTPEEVVDRRDRWRQVAPRCRWTAMLNEFDLTIKWQQVASASNTTDGARERVECAASVSFSDLPGDGMGAP